MTSSDDSPSDQGLRIALIGPAHPFRGGIASFNERLARALQSAGHTVKIVTFTRQYPEFLFPGQTQYSESPKPGDLDIDRWLHAYNPLNWPRCAMRLRKWSPDLVIVAFWLPLMGMCLGSLIRLFGRKGKVRFIGLIHNLIPHEPRPGDKLLTRFFMQRLDAALTLSASVRSDVETFKPDLPVRSHPHPIYDHFGEIIPKEVARKALGLQLDQRYVLFFGFIREYKGLDLFIRMMTDQRLRELDVKGIIAGEFYTASDPYIELIEETQTSDSLVLRTDYIPDAEVAAYFSAADLVVQPYKQATQSGITQIAYAFNKPVVVTDTGGLSQMVEHMGNGYIVEPVPPALAGAVADFYSQGREAAFVKRSSELRARYSWDGFVRALLQLYTP